MTKLAITKKEEGEPEVSPVRELTLPKAKDEALTFYAVNLHGQAGVWPAIPILREKLNRLENPEDPFDYDILPMFAATAEQKKIMEKPPMIWERNDQGRKRVYNEVRAWKNASRFYKDRIYYEDLGFCRGKRDRFVEDVTLYCPVRERVSGVIQDHGPYAGTGQATSWDPRGKYEGGECPSCTRDERRRGEFRALALKTIRNAYIMLNADMPSKLMNALMREGLMG